MGHHVILVMATLLAVLLMTWDSTALKVHFPSHLARREYATQRFRFGPPLWSGRDYRGRIMIIPPEDLCRGVQTTPWRGIILMTTPEGCSVVEKVLKAQSNGAVGVLLFKSKNSNINYETKGADATIPAEVLDVVDYNAIKEAIDENIAVEASLGYSLDVLRYAV